MGAAALVAAPCDEMMERVDARGGDIGVMVEVEPRRKPWRGVQPVAPTSHVIMPRGIGLGLRGGVLRQVEGRIEHRPQRRWDRIGRGRLCGLGIGHWRI